MSPLKLDEDLVPIRNLARIKSTALGYEDHGILTAWLHVEYEDHGGQGIGGYCLDEWNPDHHRREGTAYGTDWIIGVLRAVPCERWENLTGKLIYVLTKKPTYAGTGYENVLGIEGLAMNKGTAFYFENLRLRHFKDEAKVG